MTSQYTQSAQLSASKLIANAFSSKQTTNNTKTLSSKSFDKVFNNASKNYADKSDNNVIKNSKNDYTKSTKNITSNQNRTTQTNNNEAQNNSNINAKVNNKNTRKNSAKSETKTESTDNLQNKTDIKNDIADNKQIENTQDLNTTNETLNEQVKEQVNEQAAITQNPQTEPNLIISAAEAVQQIAETLEKGIEIPAEILNEQADKSIVQQPSNNVANQQILANIQYEEAVTPNIDVKLLENIDKQTLENLISTAKSQGQQQSSIQLNPTNTTADIQTALENIVTDSQNQKLQADLTEAFSDSKTSINQDLNQDNATNITLKSAKENLAADSSRLTANLENVTPDKVPTTNLKAPAEVKAATDTVVEARPEVKVDTKPEIKVTQEVAASVQQNSQNTTDSQNQDKVFKANPKATAKLADIQDTQTVVTHVKNNNQHASQNGGNNSLAQNNAQEIAAKLNVNTTNSTNLNQTMGAESFINKLDAQLATKGASAVQNSNLEKTDILSQVTQKFEQLQQSSNNRVSIVLQPENLGKVAVEIMNSKDGIIAKMTTDNHQVKELFDKNIESLKTNLSSQGVNVNNIKVECTQESSNNTMNFERDQFNQSFNNQQQGNQANQSDKNQQTSYHRDLSDSNDAEQNEVSSKNEFSNERTTIKHNGKVDYTV